MPEVLKPEHLQRHSWDCRNSYYHLWHHRLPSQLFYLPTVAQILTPEWLLLCRTKHHLYKQGSYKSVVSWGGRVHRQWMEGTGRWEVLLTWTLWNRNWSFGIMSKGDNWKLWMQSQAASPLLSLLPLSFSHQHMNEKTNEGHGVGVLDVCGFTYLLLYIYVGTHMHKCPYVH